MRSALQAALARVGPLDGPAMAAARQRLDELTKPPGSLGRLERLAIQLAGITAQPRPRLDYPQVIIMAADHGVAAEGVSAYPTAVTAQMLRTFVQGGAAINVLARRAGAGVVVVDVGVAEALPATLPILHRKVAFGSANLARGPALSRQQVLQAVEVGLEVVQRSAEQGAQLIGLGEMGIGNTTPASAMVAVLTGAAVRDVTGRGTGIDDATWQRKVCVIEQALRRTAPDPNDALDVLAKVGGLDIAGLVGVILGAAARRLPVLMDGFITGAAALAAVALCPAARGYLIATHRSVERGHAATLQHLDVEPLLALDLRLGEGSGAALALPIVQAALAILNEMATFAEAAVSGPRSPQPLPPGPV